MKAGLCLNGSKAVLELVASDLSRHLTKRCDDREDKCCRQNQAPNVWVCRVRHGEVSFSFCS